MVLAQEVSDEEIDFDTGVSASIRAIASFACLVSKRWRRLAVDESTRQRTDVQRGYRLS